VFDAWVDPNTAAQWLIAAPGGTMVRVEIDAHAGSSFRFVDRREGEDIEQVGEYLEIDTRSGSRRSSATLESMRARP
jgi:uncharacterized protein YndB with AHSA1/START domain